MMSEKLSVFQLGNDLVIAKSRADAIVVWQETTGEDFEDYYAHWDVIPAPKIITITFSELKPEYTELPRDAVVKMFSDDSYRVTASALAWIDTCGRGILASEDI